MQLRTLPTTEVIFAGIEVASFGLMGALIGASARAAFFPILILLVVGIILGAVIIAGTDILMHVINPRLREQYGDDVIHRVTARQFLMLLPFVLMGIVSQFFMGWDAAQAFTICGLLVAAANLGAELVRLGGKKVPNILLATGSAFVFSLLWLVVTISLAGLWHG
jgi:hypothetical protein